MGTGYLTVTVRRLTGILVAILVGAVVARMADMHHAERSEAYFLVATALLTIGLYGSTHGIRFADVRPNIRIIALAITFGVVAKAVLITVVMYLAFSAPVYLVLGVAVAQIDPLSVAAMTRRSRLSSRGKAILAAWASFDDPVTMVFTICVSTFALRAVDRGPSSGFTSGGFESFAVGLAANALFVAGVVGLWHAVRRIGGAFTNTLGIVLVVVALTVAVSQFLMFGVAIIGLFVRPSFGEALDRCVRAAFMVASIGLGVVLVDGVQVVPAVVLGTVAFAAQVVVGLPITRQLPRRDRLYLAFSQQNGITAIILALLLEKDFPGTVGVVAPAILIVNLLHGMSTAWCDRLCAKRAPLVTADYRPRPIPTPQSARGC